MFHIVVIPVTRKIKGYTKVVEKYETSITR